MGLGMYTLDNLITSSLMFLIRQFITQKDGHCHSGSHQDRQRLQEVQHTPASGETTGGCADGERVGGLGRGSLKDGPISNPPVKYVHEFFFIPFTTDVKVSSAISLEQIRYIMAQEEKMCAESGLHAVHSVSASAFILLAVEVQTLQ